MVCASKLPPSTRFDPRPFASQTKVAFETPSTIVYDKKFDTAIRASHIEQHYSRVAGNRMTLDDNLTIRLKNYPKKIASHDDAVSTHAKIFVHLHSKVDAGSFRRVNHKVGARTRRMYDATMDNITFQANYLNSKNYMGTRDKIMKDINAMRASAGRDWALLNALFDYSDWLLGVMNLSNVMYSDYYKGLEEDDYLIALSRMNTKTYPPLDLEISWSHQYCVIKHEGASALLPKSYILMLHNKVCDYISTLLYAKLACHSAMPNNMETLVINFSLELCHIVINYGQNGFSILKCLEALASGEALCELEQWDNSDFLKIITKDLELDTGFSYRDSDLRAVWKKCPTPVKHELACLSKIAGHPLVNMEAGAYKIHKYTTEEYKLDYDKINESVCYIKQNYIRNHIFRTGVWPPHEVTSRFAPDAIRYGSLKSLDPEGEQIRRQYGTIKITDYNYVELRPALRFNNLESVIPHLKDKTISILKSKVIAKYLDKSDVKVSWSDTRLLLFYLLHDTETTDHLEFIQQYASGVDMEEFLDYLVIRIVPKEKELKVEFRGFGCTTFANRMLFLAQEKNAMHYLDLFCDEQAMTLSELDLTKRLYTFRCLAKVYPRHHVLYVMVDASKWNNHFRAETCDRVLEKTLDPIFDTKIYGRTQDKYKNTQFYVPDGDYTYEWMGQDGGVEGLNQDSWVITYIAQIKTSLSGYDLKVHVLCKGDDLRLAVLIPMNDDRSINMSATKKEIMTELAATASGMGHEVKVYESYGSTRYFNFSKNASIDCVELSQVLRKIPKCYGATNAFLPSFDEYIGSTFSNAHSACRVTTNQIPCYFVALMWSYYYLLSDVRPLENRIKEKVDASSHAMPRRGSSLVYYDELSDVELLAVMLVPSILGGFPIIYLHNMMVRAESDLLTPFLDMLIFMRETGIYQSLLVVMKNFLVFERKKITTWKPLYMDIYCLPLNQPLTPTQVLRNEIVPALRRTTRNQLLLDLFESIDNEESSNAAIKILDSAEQIEPKVMSVIYSALPESILGEIVRKFESARSVLELIILGGRRRAHTASILRRVVTADVNIQQWRIKRLRREHDTPCYDAMRLYATCPAEFAQTIRNTLWTKPVNGVTMPPMRHLLSFYTPLSGMQDTHIVNNHFTFHLDLPEQYVSSPGNFHFGVGTRKPFLGHITGTGTVSPSLQLVDKDIILSKLRNLAELCTWTDRQFTDEDGTVISGNLRELVARIFRVYTQEPLESFSPFLGARRSGTIAHHIRSRAFRESIMPNSLSNLYQLIVGESNSHGRFAGDHDHYWINFLQIYCHSVCMIVFEVNASPRYTTPSSIWVASEACNHCMRPVVERPVVLNLTALSKVRFQRLDIATIASQTLKILRESLDLVSGRKYNLEGHARRLTVEQASAGVLNHVLDLSVRRVQRTVDRYTAHASTPEALRLLGNISIKTASRSLGVRELSCMDNDFLVEYVPFLVTRLIMEQFSASTVKNMPESFNLIRPNHLPWYPLLEELSRVGRTNLLVRELGKTIEVGCTTVVYTPEQAAPYLGALSLRAMTYPRTEPDLVILSNYSTPAVVREVRLHCLRLARNKFMSDHHYYGVTMECDNDERQTRIKNLVLSHMLIDYVLSNVKLVLPDDGDTLQYTNRTIAEFIATPEDNADDPSWEDQLAEMGMMDIDGIKEMMGCQFYYYRHIGKMKNDEIELALQSEIYSYITACHTFFERTRFTSIVTTLSACTDTLRTIGVPFTQRRGYEIDMPGSVSPVLVTQHEPVFRGSVSRSFRCTSVYRAATTYPARTVLTRPGIQVPSASASNRPFGVNNASMNHLLYILAPLGVLDVDNVTRLSISVMGDGYGNGTALLATMFSECRFVYTSAPGERMTEFEPVVALESLDYRRHQLSNDHVRHGIYDLSRPETFSALESLYGRHNIYWCDAEAEPGTDQIKEVYVQVAEYYVRSRCENALFIMQVSLEHPKRICRVLTLLTQYCSHVHIVTPPSVKCRYRTYLVAYGTSARVPMEVSVPPEPSEAVVVSFNLFVQKVIDDTRAVKTQATAAMRFTTVHGPFYSIKNLLPPLWVSLYSKLFNVAISDDDISGISSSAADGDQLQLHTSLQRLRLVRAIAKIRSQLDNPAQRLVNRQAYSDDTHTSRVHRIALMMAMLGFNEIIDHYCGQGCAPIPEKVLRRRFIAELLKLAQRDYDVNDTYVGMYTANMRKNGIGIAMPYWKRYLQGCEIAQSLTSWIAMQQVTTESYRRRQYAENDQ